MKLKLAIALILSLPALAVAQGVPNHVRSKTSVWLNYDGTTTHSYLYAGDAAAVDDHYLQFNVTAQEWELSDILTVPQIDTGFGDFEIQQSGDVLGTANEITVTGGTDALFGSDSNDVTLAIHADIARDSEIPVAANPTATVNGTVVNGSAGTWMRSDGAPALADPFTPADGTQNITGAISVSGTGTFGGSILHTSGEYVHSASPVMRSNALYSIHLDDDDDVSNDYFQILAGDDTVVFKVYEDGTIEGGITGGLDDIYLRNDGDTATGDYNFDSGTLFVDSVNNRVGAGTASPAVAFEANGSGASAIGIFERTDAGNMQVRLQASTQNWALYNDDAGFFGLVDITNSSAIPFKVEEGAPTNTAVVDSNGRFGIGTASPSQLLHVYGTSTQKMMVESQQPGLILKETDNIDENLWMDVNGGHVRLFGVTDALGGFSTLVDIDIGTGNFGIGTATPSYDLDVSGTARITSDLTIDGGFNGINGSQSNFTIVQTPATSSLIGIDPQPQDGTSAATVRLLRATNTTGSKAVQVFKGDNTATVHAQVGVDGNASYFQIGGGNFGIGDSTPDAPLEVLSSTTPQVRISHTDGTDRADLVVSSVGNLSLEPSGTLVNIEGELQVAGHAYPGTDSTYTMGTTSLRWSTVYGDDLDAQDDAIIGDDITMNSANPAIVANGTLTVSSNSSHIFVLDADTGGSGDSFEIRNDSAQTMFQAWEAGGFYTRPVSSITAVEGAVYYDSDDNKLKVYNGSTWDNLN